jgi:hypothetical protein
LDSVLVIVQIAFWLLVQETLNNTQISFDGAGWKQVVLTSNFIGLQAGYQLKCI